jgi:hypothetical protein
LNLDALDEWPHAAPPAMLVWGAALHSAKMGQAE